MSLFALRLFGEGVVDFRSLSGSVWGDRNCARLLVFSLARERRFWLGEDHTFPATRAQEACAGGGGWTLDPATQSNS